MKGYRERIMMTKDTAKVGIIGGSGLYDIEGIKNLKTVKIKTPFGDPSDAVAP